MGTLKFATADLEREPEVVLDRTPGKTFDRGYLNAVGICLSAYPILQAPPSLDVVHPHDQSSDPMVRTFLDNTILCTSEAPSTRRAWRA